MNIPQDIGASCVEGQGFGQNYNPLYHAGGLLGHTGIDINCGWASPIAALCSGIVYSTYPIEAPAADGYTAVFTLVETPLETFEFSYGHVSEIDCILNQQVKAGDIIAKEGNHGEVYSGNTLITLAMQAAGDHDGHHRHYQKRPVIKTKTPGNNQFLVNTWGAYTQDGYYFQVYDFNNGFNGCVDWTKPLFTRALFLGTSGYDVYLLQKALVLEGYGSFAPTGFFGVLTLAAVMKYQTAKGLSPVGSVGPLTRASLNGTYGQLA